MTDVAGVAQAGERVDGSGANRGSRLSEMGGGQLAVGAGPYRSQAVEAGGQSSRTAAVAGELTAVPGEGVQAGSLRPPSGRLPHPARTIGEQRKERWRCQVLVRQPAQGYETRVGGAVRQQSRQDLRLRHLREPLCSGGSQQLIVVPVDDLEKGLDAQSIVAVSELVRPPPNVPVRAVPQISHDLRGTCSFQHALFDRRERLSRATSPPARQQHGQAGPTLATSRSASRAVTASCRISATWSSDRSASGAARSGERPAARTWTARWRKRPSTCREVTVATSLWARRELTRASSECH